MLTTNKKSTSQKNSGATPKGPTDKGSGTKGSPAKNTRSQQPSKSRAQAGKDQVSLNLDRLFGVELYRERDEQSVWIDRDKIESDIEQPRKTFLGLEELGESLRQHGQLQALIVRPHPVKEGKYLIIGGERRWRASAPQYGDVPRLRCLVREVEDNREARVLALIENLQREDLPPLEEANGLSLLLDEMSLTIRDAAKLIGKDKGYLENRLRLLKMSPDVQEMVSFRKDTLQHARLIEAVTNAKLRAELLRAVKEEGISHREVQRRIAEHDTSAQVDFDGIPLAGTSGTADGRDLSFRKDKTSGGGAYDSDSGNNGISISRTPTRPDPVQQALKPAVSFAAEAARQIKTISISPDYRADILRELALLEQQITQIRKAVK